MNELPAGEAQQKTAAGQPEGSLEEIIRKALEDTRREQREVALMLEQSQAEVSRLGQKSASVVAYVKQMRERKQWEDMAAACETALDAQQRYLIMRGQLEKLQQVYEALGRFEETLVGVQKAAEQAPAARQGGNGQNSLAVLEMLVQAQEAERQRLSRQMHDGPAQALSNFILQTEIASRLFEVDPDSARQELQALKAGAAHTFQQVREFIFELRPMMLDDLGLVPTVKRYLETLSKQGEAQIKVQVFGEERRYAGYLEVFVFRALQELISAAIHDRKATRVNVRLDLDERQVRVEMTDNGDLLDADAAESNVGVRLLRERVEMLGGSMTLGGDEEENRIVFEVLAPQLN